MIELVRLQNISKRFPGGILANDDVTCQAARGEVHAILGENGAGKTTLMNILAGLMAPSSGSIHIDDRLVKFNSPGDARRAGIGMVHQHFSLVPALTVAENLNLSDSEAPFWFDPKRWSRKLAAAAEVVGFEIRPESYVRQLSMGERQRVEIFRLITQGARVLILDEPTSILAPPEAERLFEHLRALSASGHIIFLVTHKIQHVRAIADRVTVLRRGRVVAHADAASLSESELAEWMVGRPIDLHASRRGKGPAAGAATVLALRNVVLTSAYAPVGSENVSFLLRAGEILGIAGVGGNGQSELVAALTGTQSYQGVIEYPQTGGHRTGVAYIPADRKHAAAALSMSEEENLALRCYDRPPFAAGPLMRAAALKAMAEERIAQYGIEPSDPQTPVGNLSGGNLQKVVLARELAENPQVIIAESPTAGLDVATVEFVHRQLRRQSDSGAGVLLVSEDLDELMMLCDRILVMFAGRIAGEFKTAPDQLNAIGLVMSGIPLLEADVRMQGHR